MVLPLPARARLGVQAPYTQSPHCKPSGGLFGRGVPKTASREALGLGHTSRVAGGVAEVSMNSRGLPESFTELVGSAGQPPAAR